MYHTATHSIERNEQKYGIRRAYRIAPSDGLGDNNTLFFVLSDKSIVGIPSFVVVDVFDDQGLASTRASIRTGLCQFCSKIQTKDHC